MAGNIDVGLGLGLQAQLQAPAQVFARQQQQKVMAQQAAMKKAAEDEDLLYRLQKDISVNSKDLHRLVKEPVANMTATAINELIKAKNSGEANWRNKAVDITNNYKNQIAHLSGLSEQYKNFEKNYEMLGNYKTREQQSLRELMNGSQTYTEMLDKAKSKGFTGLDTESGLITSNQFMPRVNLNRELDNTFSKVNPIETKLKTVKQGDNEYQEITSTIPYFKTDAAAIAQKKGLTFIPSIESTADEIVMDPVLRNQYADTYNINPQDTEALKASIMQQGSKFVKDSVKRRNLGNGNNVRVFVNTGEDKGVFTWAKSVEKNFSPSDLFRSTSAGNMGVNADEFTTIKTANLVNQNNEPVPASDIAEKKVSQFRILPYVSTTTGRITPAKYGEREKIKGYKIFVMFGDPGDQYFLPIEDFSYSGLMRAGKDISSAIQESVVGMQDYTNKLNETYLTQRKITNSPIRKAFATGDTDLLTESLASSLNTPKK